MCGTVAKLTYSRVIFRTSRLAKFFGLYYMYWTELFTTETSIEKP